MSDKGKKRRKCPYFFYLGLAIGIAIGAIFGGVEYGEPWLGALVGSGLGPIIAFVLNMRFDQPK